MLEISDLIVDYDPETLARRPVRKSQVVQELTATGQGGAARYVASLPDSEGILDPAVCDGILIRAHTELQRLNEEFLQDARFRALLLPLLATLREAGLPPPYRVVDVGCGMGYIVRALAAHGRLGRDVELMGCDLNAALVERATQLAAEEHLACSFRTANAFTLKHPAHIFLSTGVVHHFRGASLERFFAGQREAHGFLHYDMQASVLAPLGSWLFHRARMREPLARHDGVVSARRAHPMATLLCAAREGSGLTCVSVDEVRSPLDVALRPMTAVLGLRADLWPSFTGRLGDLRSHLGSPQPRTEAA